MDTLQSSSLTVSFYLGNEIAENSSLFSNLVRTFIKVFNATGESGWGESWSVQSAEYYLHQILKSNESRVFVTLLQNKASADSVIGFCVAKAGSLKKILSIDSLPKDIDIISRKKMLKSLFSALKKRGEIMDGDYIYFIEFGISPEYRGGSKRVTDLIIPILINAIDQSKKKLIFWTSQKSNFFNLRKLVSTQEILACNDEQKNVFFLANALDTLKYLQLSESAINSILKSKL